MTFGIHLAGRQWGGTLDRSLFGSSCREGLLCSGTFSFFTASVRDVRQPRGGGSHGECALGPGARRLAPFRTESPGPADRSPSKDTLP